jgi:BirA family biotin operon repressor/biotin-[acetyl-CoA-carboxylase] ligase
MENLYFTLVLRCPMDVHRRLPVIVPTAVCRAIREVVPAAAIKWPNDIWISERKACGMLIDAEIPPGGAVAFPGIGINVNGDPTLQPELRDIATSLARETGSSVSRERLLASICNELEMLLEADEGHVASQYREMSCILGRQVTVHPHGAEAFEGVATEIALTGDLGVRRADGSVEWVTAADVTLRTVTR